MGKLSTNIENYINMLFRGTLAATETLRLTAYRVENNCCEYKLIFRWGFIEVTGLRTKMVREDIKHNLKLKEQHPQEFI